MESHTLKGLPLTVHPFSLKERERGISKNPPVPVTKVFIWFSSILVITCEIVGEESVRVLVPTTVDGEK